MPGINGLELANTVKMHEKYRNIPLILITSNTEVTSTFEHCGVFNEIIYKPFSAGLILGKVAALVA
jgi:CheY-like chemotaxis protein